MNFIPNSGVALLPSDTTSVVWTSALEITFVTDFKTVHVSIPNETFSSDLRITFSC